MGNIIDLISIAFFGGAIFITFAMMAFFMLCVYNIIQIT